MIAQNGDRVADQGILDNLDHLDKDTTTQLKVMLRPFLNNISLPGNIKFISIALRLEPSGRLENPDFSSKHLEMKNQENKTDFSFPGSKNLKEQVFKNSLEETLAQLEKCVDEEDFQFGVFQDLEQEHLVGFGEQKELLYLHKHLLSFKKLYSVAL